MVEACDETGKPLSRDAAGKLHPQPPRWMLNCTENQLSDYYLNETRAEFVAMDTLRQWFRETRSWSITKRYW
jgi:hypothetical protein